MVLFPNRICVCVHVCMTVIEQLTGGKSSPLSAIAKTQEFLRTLASWTLPGHPV